MVAETRREIPTRLGNHTLHTAPAQRWPRTQVRAGNHKLLLVLVTLGRGMSCDDLREVTLPWCSCDATQRASCADSTHV